MDELTRLAMAAGRGDELALEAFVRRSQADVWRFCAGLDHRDRADDLTQETYLRALPALSRFRAEAPARSWLLSIARRVVADSIRRATRDRRLIDRLQPRVEALRSPSGLVDLQLLVARLPVERREAFVLTQTLGLSYGEAADVVGCPIGTIRSRVARAREQLVAMASAPARGEAGN